MLKIKWYGYGLNWKMHVTRGLSRVMMDHGKNPTNFLHINIGGERLPLLLTTTLLFWWIFFPSLYSLSFATLHVVKLLLAVSLNCRAITYDTHLVPFPIKLGNSASFIILNFALFLSIKSDILVSQNLWLYIISRCFLVQRSFSILDWDIILHLKFL